MLSFILIHFLYVRQQPEGRRQAYFLAAQPVTRYLSCPSVNPWLQHTLHLGNSGDPLWTFIMINSALIEPTASDTGLPAVASPTMLSSSKTLSSSGDADTAFTLLLNTEKFIHQLEGNAKTASSPNVRCVFAPFSVTIVFVCI